MNGKLIHFALIVALVILGYLVGCVVARFAAVSRLLARIVGLLGAIVAFVGIVAADEDHRFFILAEVGLFLQIAGFVCSFKIKQPLRRRTLDLWASHKESTRR
jgi:NhaP-type Na+/H+ or K+/H+ antiporter